MNKFKPIGSDGFILGKYNVSNTTGLEIQVCYMQNVSSDSTLWQTNNPMVLQLPALALQLSLIIFFTRIVEFVLQPLRQPRFVAEFIAGILTGPTFFGALAISSIFFTFELNLVVETFTGLGLTYYMFLVGLEMDLSALRHIDKKSLSIALAGILTPLIVGAGLFFVPLRAIKNGEKSPLIGAVFWAITLSNTSFPDLARILSNVKLLHTDLGRISLTSALISDITSWALLVTTITFFDLHRFYMAVVPTVIFLLSCWFLLRPSIDWMLRQQKKKGQETFNETHINFILVGVALCGCIADACGSHSLVGGFILGLIIPHGEFALKIMERIEVFVNGIMMPAFFLMTGQKINLRDLALKTKWANLALVTISATSTKIVSTLLVCLFFGMPSKEGLGLGVLLNTKGVLSVIVLNEGRSIKALDNIMLLVMGFTILFMTSMVAPIFFLLKTTTKRFSNYKQRTIQRSNPDTELRILTCIHSTRNVSGIINLLKLSHASRKSPICLFAVHLVELTGTGRASTMLIVHDTRKRNPNNGNNNNNNMTRERVESEQIINAFANYESTNDAVTVNPLTAVSPYATMHEDIFQLAEDRQVAFILVPYHKQPTVDGRLQGDNLSIREVNKNLFVKTPCSIGILVDRGLGPSIHSDSTIYEKPGFRLAMFFIGGPDDHEALSYATRMAGTVGVSLTVVRFLPGKDAEDIQVKDEDNENGILESLAEKNDAKEFDDEFINEFRFKTMCDQYITYQEKQVNSGDELVESISSNYNDFDLYIVGRGHEAKSPLIAGLSEWSDSPELGPIGETLVTTQATEHASVLVVQQAAIGLKAGAQRSKTKLGQNKWASPILNPDYGAFMQAESAK